MRKTKKKAGRNEPTRFKDPANAQGECGEDQVAGVPCQRRPSSKGSAFRFRQTMTASGELGFAERTLLRFVVGTLALDFESPS